MPRPFTIFGHSFESTNLSCLKGVLPKSIISRVRGHPPSLFELRWAGPASLFELRPAGRAILTLFFHGIQFCGVIAARINLTESLFRQLQRKNRGRVETDLAFGQAAVEHMAALSAVVR